MYLGLKTESKIITKSCIVKDLVIKKMKNPLTKTKAFYSYLQYIEGDVCTPKDRNPKDEEYLCQFTKKMWQLKTDAKSLLRTGQ